MRSLISLLCSSVLLVACGGGAPSPEPAPSATSAPAATAHPAPAPAPSELDGALKAHSWKLSQAERASGERLAVLFPNAERPLTLHFAEGRLSTSNTCNVMSGAYTLVDAGLQLGPLAQTKRACAEPGLMEADDALGARLSGTLSVSLTPGDAPSLTLTTASGERLTFTGEATAEARYGGPGERVFFEVAAQLVACNHPLIADHRCLSVREVKYDEQGIKLSTGEAQPLYQAIEGFTHEAGVRQVLRLKRYQLKDPPADGSSLVYVLDMVVESAREEP